MENRLDIMDEARAVFEIEINALQGIASGLSVEFIKIVHMICECKGNIVLTGMGKSGHIARKIAATLSSLGTPAFYLHPAEARHGDLGMVTSKDLVIAISNSGETEEVIAILANLKRIGAKIIGISSNNKSTLMENSDLAYALPKMEEACYLKLAPTSSTTGVLVLGDAIAVCVSKMKGFTRDNFALFHPSGALGKQLLIRVKDIMITDSDNAVVSQSAFLKDAIIELASKGLGFVNVTDRNGMLVGIFTDGDLRRLFVTDKIADVGKIYVSDVMTKRPLVIEKSKLAVDALKLMRGYEGRKSVSCLPVVDGGKLCGSVLLRKIVEMGII